MAPLDPSADLFDEAPCGLLSASPNGRILRVNATLLGWLGRSREEVLSMRLHELLTVGSRLYLETHVAPLLRMQRTVNELQLDFKRADEESFHTLVNIVLKLDANDAPLERRLAIFRLGDRKKYEQELLAARRKAEEIARTLVAREAELRASREWLSTTLISIGDGVIATDAEGRVTFLNPVAQALTGWTPEEAHGQPVASVFHIINARSPAGVDCPVGRVLREGVKVELATDTRLVRKDGTQLAIADSAAPMRDPEGRISGVVLVFRDVTERNDAEQERVRALEESQAQHASAATALMQARRAHEELRISETRYLLASLATTDVIWDWDLVTGQVRWNDAVTEVLGVARPDPRNDWMWWNTRIHPEDLARVTESRQRFVHDGVERWQEEYRVRREDGAYAIVDERALLGRDDAGAARQVVGVVRDVTGLRRAEEDARRRLKFEQELIGIVSHDLKNPLAAILMGAALMRRQRGQSLDERTDTLLRRIENGADRATRMVRDLLDFTQARLGGRLKITAADANLHLLTRDVVEEVRLAHPDRTITHVMDGDGRGAWDAGRLQQVVQNLVTNALTYSPPASTVRVETRSEDAQVAIEVHNAGTPIPPDRLSHIFEPLQRGTTENGEAERGKNVGLGLYIVAQIVQAHGGLVTVTSSADAGTRFRAVLPRDSGTSAINDESASSVF